jgi:3-phenylpropionate/cinnamic acid dioxygenase small subunit
MGDKRDERSVNTELFIEIQRFLTDEAVLLDSLEYEEWFALLTQDISYRISTRLVRDREDRVQNFEIVDEDYEHLKLRVAQLANPKLTRAENPASLYRRFVTNVRASHHDHSDQFLVQTYLLMYKNRSSNAQVALYSAERRDVLKRDGRQLRIEKRHVYLDQSVLVDGTLSTIL